MDGGVEDGGVADGGVEDGGVVHVEVPTSVGLGRLVVDAADAPRALLWLGHGAGGGIGAVDLAALASALPSQGITVVRYEQPWRVAGRRVAARPETLDVAWRETASVVGELAGGVPVIVGGRSAGARVACRTAAAVGAAGVVCLAFPLHPPGRPEKSRLAELLAPEVPVLVLQGERDTFGTAAVLEGEVAAEEDVRIVGVPGADHGMRVLAASPFTARDVRELVASSVARFVGELVGHPVAGLVGELVGHPVAGLVGELDPVGELVGDRDLSAGRDASPSASSHPNARPSDSPA